MCPERTPTKRGALGRIRTSDPRNRNPMLYPAELRARLFVGLPDWEAKSNISTGFPPSAATSRSTSTTRSEAGVATALSVVGRGTLNAKIVRRTIIISEGAGFRSRAVIVRIADRVRQPIGIAMPVVVPACFGRASDRGQCSQGGSGEGEFAWNHGESPNEANRPILGQNRFPSRAKSCKRR